VIQRGAAQVIVINGRMVSQAWTERGDEHACELAVETVREYRQRGYARQVAAAWAAGVLDSGRVAFYSHRLVNSASESLARSLGVVQYAVSTAYA
jgi:predicted GNAT family acetyltransferase